MMKNEQFVKPFLYVGGTILWLICLPFVIAAVAVIGSVCGAAAGIYYLFSFWPSRSRISSVVAAAAQQEAEMLRNAAISAEISEASDAYKLRVAKGAEKPELPPVEGRPTRRILLQEGFDG